jgi:hypothetical protein
VRIGNIIPLGGNGGWDAGLMMEAAIDQVRAKSHT